MNTLEILLALFLGIAICAVVIDYVTYRDSTYFKITHNPYLKKWVDLGSRGEYLTFKALKKHEENGAKFLFNLYLPKSGEETTEIDVLMIHTKGIFVFESKNYSGWIFGSDNQKMWTQTLPQGKGSRKEHFLNPIWQNKLHIKCLKEFLKTDIPIHSVIVFSERCELKKITLNSSEVKVVKRDSLNSAVKDILRKSNTVLSQQETENIYTSLYPLSQVSKEVKQKHISDIKENK